MEVASTNQCQRHGNQPNSRRSQVTTRLGVRDMPDVTVQDQLFKFKKKKIKKKKTNQTWRFKIVQNANSDKRWRITSSSSIAAARRKEKQILCWW